MAPSLCLSFSYTFIPLHPSFHFLASHLELACDPDDKITTHTLTPGLYIICNKPFIFSSIHSFCVRVSSVCNYSEEEQRKDGGSEPWFIMCTLIIFTHLVKNGDPAIRTHVH